MVVNWDWGTEERERKVTIYGRALRSAAGQAQSSRLRRHLRAPPKNELGRRFRRDTPKNTVVSAKKKGRRTTSLIEM